jgi:hypothetical protein
VRINAATLTCAVGRNPRTVSGMSVAKMSLGSAKFVYAPAMLAANSSPNATNISWEKPTHPMCDRSDV